MKLLVEIWSKMLFCVTNKIEIDALQDFCTFLTEITPKSSLSIKCLTMWLPSFILCLWL